MARAMKVLVGAVMVALVCALSGVEGGDTNTRPGLRFAVTNGGLEEMKDIALPVINAALKDLTLPNMDLQEHIPVIGHITLDLSNIKLTGFNLPDAVLAVSDPPAATLDMSGLTMTVSLDYHWRKVHWPHLSSTGSLTAEPEGGSIDLTMSVSADADGHVVLKSTTCNVDFSDFKLHFGGDLGWLYNFFVWLFKNTIKHSIESAVQKELLSVVDTSLNAELAKIPTMAYLGGGESRIDVDTGVVNLLASSSYMSLGDDLAITDNTTGVACPLVPADLPAVTPDAGNSMLQLLLDDSFINCVCWNAYSNKAMDLLVTPANLPKSFPLRLNTTDWKGFVPEMAAKYPNRPMAIALAPTSAPLINTATSGITGSLNYGLNFSVNPAPGAANISVFTFDADMALGIDIVTATLNGSTPLIVLNITEIELDLKIVSSTVGTIPLAPIQSIFNTFVPIIRKLLNDFLKNGFPLPGVDGLELVGPRVSFDTGFFGVSTNFTLIKPPQSSSSASAAPQLVLEPQQPAASPSPFVDPTANFDAVFASLRGANRRHQQ